jgi:sulfide dehydrogenase cytochrome subunit
MRHLLFMVTLLAAPPEVLAQSANSNLGRDLAATCANCHSITGKSTNGIPVIGGQQKESLARMLNEFKQGKRQGTVMNQLAKGYTDAQLDAAAAYFAAKK